MSAKPKITVSSTDLQRIEKLLDQLPANAFPGRFALEEELNRADVLEPQNMPPNVVTMNSVVRFRVSSSQEEFCLTLVYPKDMDSSESKISILAPVGSALLGLAEGNEIEWPNPGGQMLKVQIVEIVHQPERAGEYHR